MRVLEINTVYPYGSTGKIAKGICSACRDNGIECRVAYSYTKKGGEKPDDGIEISTYLDTHIHNRLARITMLTGFFSKVRTARFLRYLDKNYTPDIIHLHNLHGNYINVPMLFKYIKKHNIKTVITLHDAWWLTGYCPYFTGIGCEKWKTGCGKCPVKGRDNVNLLDLSSFALSEKKKLFEGLEDAVLVSPSAWLGGCVKESYLSAFPLYVINNGIDLDTFKPAKSDFRKKYGLENRFILLGVSFVWNERKGIDVFIELSKRLDGRFALVLVGTDDEIDKTLPDNIISVHRTDSKKELAEIYTAADVFINPTREETFGLVNIEALACGTPVITFDTDGSPECITPVCGSVVPKNDIDTLEKEILRIYSEKPFTAENCVKRAAAFDEKAKSDEYIALYKELISDKD